MLSGSKKSLFLKATPASFSLGGPLWQKLQALPVCLANAGVASAFDVARMKVKARGVADSAFRLATDLTLETPLLAEPRASIDLATNVFAFCNIACPSHPATRDRKSVV